MKTATDLREIKKLARMFVMLDIQNTEYSPLIVKHPFTDSGMVAYRTRTEVLPKQISHRIPQLLNCGNRKSFGRSRKHGHPTRYPS